MSSFNKKGAVGFGVDIPFVTHLGFELELFDGGESIITFSPKPEHLNTFGVTHGGACMTLLDVTMALAARSVQKDMGAVTIEMKTTFMRPAPSDGAPLTGKGSLLHRSATMAFVEARIFDAAGQVCAHATGTFKYVKRLPVGSKTVNGMSPEKEASGNGLGIISTD
ncbi:MAG: PaaI family thioesterase [Pseudomonadota bacterium]